jgi:hypothetical protein
MTTNAEYLAKMEIQLRKWDADFNALAAKGKQLTAEARSAYYARIKDLRAGRNAAQKIFQDMRAAAGTAGAHLNDGMEAAWGSMQKALERASSDLGAK